MLLRPARADDYPAFLRLLPELGVDDPTPSPERWTDDFVPRTIIAERDGDVLGYCAVQHLDTDGYVRHLVVGPAARRSGVGRALMDAAAARFRAAGLVSWRLNVKPGNVAARRLYEAVGLRRQYESVALRLSWAVAEALPAPLAEARVVAGEEARRCEAAMGLLTGQLTHARRIPIGLFAGGDVVGAALFDPAFPGAFPFRVAAPAWAGTLLSAIRAHRLPEPDHVGVVVEDAPLLARHLLDRGAELRLEILHYSGLLP